jgi:hypothetical protein
MDFVPQYKLEPDMRRNNPPGRNVALFKCCVFFLKMD